jgi:hypothetical protein
MKDQIGRNKSTKHRKLAIGLVAGIIVLVVGALLAFAIINGQKNYAQQAALSLEKALVREGATRVCTTGDPGRGPDNHTPWYTVYLKSSMNLKQAQEAIVAAAKDNNFNLQQSSPGTKGYLGDLVYIDKSRPSSSPELKAGPIELAVALTNSGPLHACKDEIPSDVDHTAISLELRLPEYK